jgi:hypothetical protein
VSTSWVAGEASTNTNIIINVIATIININIIMDIIIIVIIIHTTPTIFP